MIKGIVCAVPKNTVTNMDEKFVMATGVRHRRIAVEGQDTLTLATAAARQLMNKLSWEPHAIVFVTQTPTVRMPAMACILAANLGLDNCLAFDVGQACSGYMYGLFLSYNIDVYRVLLIAGDTVSRMCSPGDKL